MDKEGFAQEVRQLVEHTLQLWHVPGASVVVVKDGSLLLCEGYGLRDQAAALPMTPDTIMPIASCSKAFTSMAVGLLSDEGKLELNKPLRTYMPTFKLYDPVASEHMTPRDLLCHRSGLPRHDMLWYCSNYNRQEIFERLQYCEPNSDFRSAYYYQNMMFMVAGLLVTAVSGLSWEQFVQQRIFERLGMRRTNTSTIITQQDADHGSPYIYMKGQLNQLSYYEQDGEKDALGPAGNICSCVRDLSAWLMLHLNGGKLGDETFISANTLDQMHTPHIFIDDPQARLRLGMEFLSYGLGWYLRSYKGQKMVSHGGNMDGFASMVSFLPKHNLGIAVLTNGDGYFNLATNALTYTLYDRLLGLEATDWNEKLLEQANEALQAEALKETQSSADRKPAAPSHPIQDYLGDYQHPGYGIFSVIQQADGLHLVMNSKLDLQLQHYHYDTFEAYLERFNWHLKIAFSLDTKGNIAGLYAQMEEMVKEVFFSRLAERRISDPAFLSQLTGEYIVQDMLLSIHLAAGKLHASLPGQEYELEPYQGTEFKLKGKAGFSMAFQADETGCFTKILYNQPGIVYVAERR